MAIFGSQISKEIKNKLNLRQKILNYQENSEELVKFLSKTS
jgi:hypothetical protein